MNKYKFIASLSLAMFLGSGSVYAKEGAGTTEEEVKARYQYINKEQLSSKESIKIQSSIQSITKAMENPTTTIRNIAFNKGRVNLYSKADSNSKTVNSLNPQILSVLSKSGNYFQVSTWMGPMYVLNENNVIEELRVIPFRREMVVYERVTLHDQPSNIYKTSSTLAPQTLQVVERAGDYWFKVKSYVGEKWIYTTLGAISEPKDKTGVNNPKTSVLKGTVTATELNVRSTPSTQGAVLGRLAKNAKIEIISVENNWAIFTYNGKIAYTSADYLNIIDEVSLNPGDQIGEFSIYSKDRLKLYSKPSTDFSTGASLAPQVIKSTKRIDKVWYEVSTWMGKMYINIEETNQATVTDNIYRIQGSYNLTTRAGLYAEPFDSHPTGASLSPQSIKYTAITKGYRLVNTWLGPKWVKVSDKAYSIVEEKPITGSFTLMTSKGPINYKDATMARDAFNKISDSNAYLMSDSTIIDMKKGFVRAAGFTIIYNDSGSQLTYVSDNTEMEYRSMTSDKVYVTIAGANGYVNKQNAELIPSLKNENRSAFRRNANGKVTHRIYNGNTSYYDLNIGYSPTHLTVGQYYPSVNPKRIANQDSYQYFMYMPVRFKSSYTAKELDDFIKANSPDSPLIGTGKYFIASAEKYNLNAGYLLAHAIHESAWGKSKIALEKKNLFGFKAVDSNPYDGAASFATLEEGIDYCAGYISRNYVDTSNWKYNGGFLGDKSIGMNINYASDPYWGEKIAAYMHRLDSMYSNKELNKYPLGQINNGVSVYNMNGSTPAYQKQLSKITYALKLGQISTGQGTFYKITSDDSNYPYFYVKSGDFKSVKSY